MTCRQEVLDAIEQLHAETGRCDSSSGEEPARLRSNGSNDPAAPIRTRLSGDMIEDGSPLRSAPGACDCSVTRTDPPDLVGVPPVEPPVFITEEAVKEAAERSLEKAGWTALARWGRERGVRD